MNKDEAEETDLASAIGGFIEELKAENKTLRAALQKISDTEDSDCSRQIMLDIARDALVSDPTLKQ